MKKQLYSKLSFFKPYDYKSCCVRGNEKGSVRMTKEVTLFSRGREQKFSGDLN